MPRIDRPTAKFIKWLSRDSWFQGTALYELSDFVPVYVGTHPTRTKYVIVAITPKVLTHGDKETTIFAASSDGSLFGGFHDPSTVCTSKFVWKMLIHEAEFPECRVKGDWSHQKALNKLFNNGQDGQQVFIDLNGLDPEDFKKGIDRRRPAIVEGVNYDCYGSY